MEFYFTRLKSFLKVTSIHNPGYLLQNTEKKISISWMLQTIQKYWETPKKSSKIFIAPCFIPRQTGHLVEILRIWEPSIYYFLLRTVVQFTFHKIHPTTSHERINLQYVGRIYSYFVPNYSIIWVIWIWVWALRMGPPSRNHLLMVLCCLWDIWQHSIFLHPPPCSIFSTKNSPYDAVAGRSPKYCDFALFM